MKAFCWFASGVHFALWWGGYVSLAWPGYDEPVIDMIVMLLRVIM